MAHVELEVETSLPPSGVVAALTDFSNRRPDIWPELNRSYFEVYPVAASSPPW